MKKIIALVYPARLDRLPIADPVQDLCDHTLVNKNVQKTNHTYLDYLERSLNQFHIYLFWVLWWLQICRKIIKKIITTVYQARLDRLTIADPVQDICDHTLVNKNVQKTNQTYLDCLERS